MPWPLLVSLVGAAQAAPTWSEVNAYTAWSQFDTAKTDHAGPAALYSAKVSGTDCFKAQGDVSGAAASTLLGVATDIVGAKVWSRAEVPDGEVLEREGSTPRPLPAPPRAGGQRPPRSTSPA